MATTGSDGAGPSIATPKSSARRSARRSWFETPPATKLDIAIEKPALKTMGGRTKRRSIDDVETLVLTHFTNAPRIGFGKILVGRSKTRMLLVQNPCEYEQEVLIERFPYKKYFNIDQTHFILGPEEVVSLTLTWTPQEGGNCREMILFHINGVYRLQAYVFGTAEAPKPVRKGRKGALGNRRGPQQSTSHVVQTKSLIGIRDNYSPRKSDETRELRSQVRPIGALQIDQENVRPGELEEAEPQTPPPLESTAIFKTNDINDQAALERRKFVSPTLSKMSPIPKVDETARDQSRLLITTEMERSPLKTVNGNESPLTPNLKSLSSSGEERNRRSSNQQISGGGQSPLKSAGMSPSLQGEGSEQKAQLAASECEATRVHAHVSPRSFLSDSLAGRTAATTPEVGCIGLSNHHVTRVTEGAKVSPRSFLEDMEGGLDRKSGEGIIDRRPSIPSPSTVLNDSIPHDIMKRQLDFVRRSLQDKLSPAIVEIGAKSGAVARPPSQRQGGRASDRVSELARPKVRNVFAHAQQQSLPGKKEKFLQRKIQDRARFANIAETSSPRRKTFLVTKKQQQAKRVSPLKGQQSTTAAAQGRKAVLKKNAAKGSLNGRKDRSVPQSLDAKPERSSPEADKSPAVNDDGKVADRMESACLETSHHQEEKGCPGGKTTRRRRSLWSSPAVVGFERPILASKSECDTTGEEMQSLGNASKQGSIQDSPASLPLHQQGSESAEKGRRSSGRRLFPDLTQPQSDSLNVTADFKPLWSGSATVTKDRVSMSPPASQSGNSSRKLFADISTEGTPTPADGEVAPMHNEDETCFSSNASTLQDGPLLRAERGFSHKSAVHFLEEKAEGGDSFDFCSTQHLATSPLEEEESRRATLTVTKSHPSQALLEASKRSAHRVAMEMAAKVRASQPEDREEELWQTETIVIETKDSAVVRVSVHQEFTPSKLPTSPHSENSRRSTHVVRKPTVIDKGGLVPRSLFDAGTESQVPSTENVGTTDATVEVGVDDGSLPAEEGQRLVGLGQNEASSLTEDVRRVNYAVFTERVECHMTYERATLGKGPEGLAASVTLSGSSSDSGDLSLDSLEPLARSCLTGSTVEDRLPVEQSPERIEDVVEGNLAEYRFPVEQSPERIEAVVEGNLAEYRLPVGQSPEQIKAVVEGNLAEYRLPVEQSPELIEAVVEGNLAEYRLPVEQSPERIEAVVEGNLAEYRLPVAQSLELDEAVVEGNLVEQSHEQDESNSQMADYMADKLSAASGNLCAVGLEVAQVDTAVNRESLIKEGPASNEIIPTSASTADSGGIVRKTAAQEIEKSAGRPELLAETIQPAQLGKSAAVSNDFSGKSKLVDKPASLASGRHLTKSRSQSSLVSGKPSEPFSRKRLSPEAGVKEPRSKRVQLEPRGAVRTDQRASTRVTSASRPKVERKSRPAKGVALSKLLLVKQAKTALPKHPLPFAAKNMYYDERWQDKQERGFAQWLNFVLTPADEYAHAATKTKVDARSIAFGSKGVKAAPRLAPTKEVLSFRAYAAKRRLDHLRRASCRLFQSEEVSHVVCRLETEVERRRLAIRTDRTVHADIGVKQNILDMLLSYNPLWLRIGLETVFGETLPIQNNGDVVGMSHFILARLLFSPDIAARFAHPTVPHLYHDGYADAIAQHILKKFLVLVFYLDCAKRSRLITHDPCLFCKDAEIKSSKMLLQQFSRDYLSGEGDISKHLAYMGCICSHAQTPIDEFDYAVSNLCIDLRDGLRLGRVLMLLTGDWTFASLLRAPAISRLQKIHNVELVFKQLLAQGCDLKTVKGAVLNPRDIVDGHREKTLAFLWKIIFQFQARAVLNEEELRQEVAIVERSLRVKLGMQKLLNRSLHSDFMARRDSGGPGVTMETPVLQLLLKWCRAVCLHYGVRIENFTVSFCDGRALCCLLHHYHPALLPLDLVHFRTSQSLHDDAEVADPVDSDCSTEWADNPFQGNGDPSAFESLLANEKENFRVLYQKVSELGGIPLMLRAADMSNTIPDERVVMTYLSYLCTRLLDLREETRAARILQLAWRRLALRRSARLRQKQIAACIVIQRAWRQKRVTLTARRQEAAALALQTAWRGFQGRRMAARLRQAKRDSALHEAATKIQTAARRFLAQRNFHRRAQSAVILQSWFRAQRARRDFLHQRQACRLIQSHLRSHRQGREARERFLQQRQAAVTLQRAYRLKTRRQAERVHREALRQRQAEKVYTAACTIQSAWKGRKLRREFLCQRRSAVTIQAWWKGRKLQQDFTLQRRSAVTIQAWWKGHVAQSRFVTQRTAATIIQRQFRATRLATVVREEFVQKRQAAVTVQSSFRSWRQRGEFLQLKQAAIVVQKNFRRYKNRVRFLALRAATVIVQRALRAHLARRMRETCALRIQTAYRAHAARSLLTTLREQAAQERAAREKAATAIQAAFRGHRQQRQFQATRKSAVLLQTWGRGWLARQQLQQMRHALAILADYQLTQERHQTVMAELHQRRRSEAAVVVQAAWRGLLQRRRYLLLLASVRVVQVRFQAKQLAAQVREEFVGKRQAAVAIQACWKGRKVQQEFLRQRRSAVSIQARWKGRKLRQEFLCQRRSAVSIQARWKGRQVRQEFTLQKRSAVIIQARWKGRKVRQEFLSQRLSAVTIQAWWKGREVHQEFLRQRRSAVTIQAWWKGHVAQSRFVTQRTAATIIQRQFRATRLAARIREEFVSKRRAAVTVQRRYRAVRLGRSVRLQFQLMVGAAVVVQACWKRYVVRSCYLRVRHRVILCQAQTRAFLARRKFQKQRTAAICLQRRLRARLAGQRAEREFQTLRRGIVRLQALVRGRLERQRQERQRQAEKVHTAACTVQSLWRGRKVRREFVLQRQAAVTIQRAYRLQKQRQAEKFDAAACTIQSAWKGWRLRQEFLRQKRAAVTMQSRWKGRKQRQDFVIRRRSAVVIQAQWKGYLAQSHFTNLCKAATVIQRRFRAKRLALRTREEFVSKRLAAVTVQRRYRAVHLGRSVRRHFQLMVGAAVVVQAWWKRYVVRSCYLGMRCHVILCQAQARTLLARRKFQKQRAATICLQRRFRARLARQRAEREFQTLRRGFVLLQALVRGRLERQRQERQRQAEKVHTAACTMQSLWRGRKVRREFVLQRQAAVTIQRVYRLQKQRLAEKSHTAACTIQSAWKCWRLRQEFLRQRRAAMTMQSYWKGKKQRQDFVIRRRSAIVIQAWWKGYLVRSHFIAQRKAASVIQRRFRSKQLASRTREEFVSKRRAAVTVQRCYRAVRLGRSVRLRFQLMVGAAVVVQACWKRYVVRSCYLRVRRQVILCQAQTRAFLARRKFQKQRTAAICLQRRFRAKLAGQQSQREFQTLRHGFVRLQALIRERLERQRQERQRRAAVTLQRAYRLKTRRQAERVHREALRQRQAEKVHTAACTIQSAWKGRKLRQEFLCQRQSAVTIQAWWKGRKLRQDFTLQRRSAVTVQAWWKGHVAQSRFVTQRTAATIIQRQFRANRLATVVREEFVCKRQGAVTLQRAFRLMKRRQAERLQVLRELERRRRAAVTLQRAVRFWMDRRRAAEEKRRVAAATVLQTAVRAWRERRREEVRLAERARHLERFECITRRHLAVMMIQRWYRRSVTVRKCRQQLPYVIMLQTRVRMFLQRSRFLREKRELAERRMREERAAQTIQSAFRKWRAQQEEKRYTKKVTIIQSLWRGRKVRRSLKSKKIAAARKRVHEANEKATEEKTLRNRTTSALDFLLHYKQLSHILDALMHLDVATRLSSVCCERLVEVNAVAVIYRLILSCNRSLPHMELIRFSISILLNLAKYEKTTHAVLAVPEAVSTLVDLMSVYREKGCGIFTKTCMLLAVLASDPQRRTEMCSDQRTVSKLQSIHVLVLRKHRMQATRARQASASLNATLPSRLAAPKTFRVRPAWNLRRDSLKDFDEPLPALSFLLNTLHIRPK